MSADLLLDRETVVQKVTDAATELTRAEFGAFFYNVVDEKSGEAFMLYALLKEAASKLGAVWPRRSVEANVSEAA